jgi:hypothetical protein
MDKFTATFILIFYTVLPYLDTITLNFAHLILVIMITICLLPPHVLFKIKKVIHG